MSSTVQIDKYARDAITWKASAQMTYTGAHILFTHENNLITCFSAGVLGHLAIEQYLKSALIHAGMTVFDPRKLKYLPASGTLQKSDCAWGHDLVALAEMLSRRRPAFEISTILFNQWSPYDVPITVRKGLEIFESFFDELRYSGQLTRCEGIGPMDGAILEELVRIILPFTPPSA